jgi:hypothetical protein
MPRAYDHTLTAAKEHPLREKNDPSARRNDTRSQETKEGNDTIEGAPSETPKQGTGQGFLIDRREKMGPGFFEEPGLGKRLAPPP